MGGFYDAKGYSATLGLKGCAGQEKPGLPTKPWSLDHQLFFLLLREESVIRGSGKFFSLSFIFAGSFARARPWSRIAAHACRVSVLAFGAWERKGSEGKTEATRNGCHQRQGNMWTRKVPIIFTHGTCVHKATSFPRKWGRYRSFYASLFFIGL